MVTLAGCCTVHTQLEVGGGEGEETRGWGSLVLGNSVPTLDNTRGIVDSSVARCAHSFKHPSL